MSKTHSELTSMVNELVDVVDQLTPWEYDFINDMSNKVIQQETFSNTEAEKIIEVYERNSDKL